MSSSPQPAAPAPAPWVESVKHGKGGIQYTWRRKFPDGGFVKLTALNPTDEALANARLKFGITQPAPSQPLTS